MIATLLIVLFGLLLIMYWRHHSDKHFNNDSETA